MKKRKRLILISFLFLAIVTIFTLNISLKSDSTNSKSSKIAIYIPGSNGYELSEYKTIPEGYMLNESESYCEYGSTLSWNEETDTISLRTNRSDSCYIYLDLIVVVTLDNQSADTAGTVSIYETYNTKYSLTSNGDAMSTSANPITIPTKSGYTFMGYYTETDSGGTQYIDENGYLTLSASTTNFTETGILYAYWEESCNDGIDSTGYKNFAYTGAVQNFTACPGNTYRLQVWGAAGARGAMTGTFVTPACKREYGGYSIGDLTVSSKTALYVYVGGSPTKVATSNTSFAAGGFNGGGSANFRSDSGAKSLGPGGGATDIRIGTDSLYARVIVAGGGGGAAINKASSGVSYVSCGGVGGGTSGGDGTSGNAGGGSGGSATGDSKRFGYGAARTSSLVANRGGGGGWYGGGKGSGGSGYVYTKKTASNYPTGCLLNTEYYLTNASTTAGDESFPSTSGGTETGHSGDGYARITRVS